MLPSYFMVDEIFVTSKRFFKPPNGLKSSCLCFIWYAIYLFIECFGRGSYISLFYHSLGIESSAFRSTHIFHLVSIFFVLCVCLSCLCFFLCGCVCFCLTFTELGWNNIFNSFCCPLSVIDFLLASVIAANFYWLQTVSKISLSFSQLFLNQPLIHKLSIYLPFGRSFLVLSN